MERKSEMLPNTVSSSGNYSLLKNKRIGYKHAVSLVHYCRLLNKVLQFPRYNNKYIRKWLLFFIEDLRDNAQIVTNKQSNLASLRTALDGYYSQYVEKDDIKPVSGINK